MVASFSFILQLLTSYGNVPGMESLVLPSSLSSLLYFCSSGESEVRGWKTRTFYWSFSRKSHVLTAFRTQQKTMMIVAHPRGCRIAYFGRSTILIGQSVWKAWQIMTLGQIFCDVMIQTSDAQHFFHFAHTGNCTGHMPISQNPLKLKIWNLLDL